MVGEGTRGGVVEDEGGREPQSGDGVEAVAEFDGGQRVESQLGEGPSGVDGRRGVVPQDRGHLGADQVQQGAFPVRGGQVGHPPLLVGRRAGGGPAGDGADEAAQQRWRAVGPASHGGGVDLHGDEVRAAGTDRGVEEPQGVVGGQPGDPVGGHALQGGGVQCGAHAGAGGPQAPGEGRGGQSVRRPVGGEGVQVRVGGGVVALARSVEDGGERGEQHEVGQVPVEGEFVQVPGAGGLGVEDLVDHVVGEALDDAVANRARGVDDGVDRMPGQQVAYRLPVADVAGGHGHLGAQRGQFGVQSGGVPPAAGEDQPAHPVGAHQVVGEQGA